MLNEIGQLNIDVNEDTCTWSLGPNGTFTVKDARYRIDQNILPTLAHATTWDKSIPRKVNVFMWRLSLDRLPHRLNLSSRGMDIPAISCPSCNANVESANHVFFECDIATDMWKLVFRWCDIPLFQASSWDSFNDWIISWHASKEKKHRFYVITTSVLWWLWRYRNSVTFSSQPLRKSDLFDNVRFSSFSWLHNRDHMKLSWNDWLMYPLSITRNGNANSSLIKHLSLFLKLILAVQNQKAGDDRSLFQVASKTPFGGNDETWDGYRWPALKARVFEASFFVRFEDWRFAARSFLTPFPAYSLFSVTLSMSICSFSTMPYLLRNKAYVGFYKVFPPKKGEYVYVSATSGTSHKLQRSATVSEIPKYGDRNWRDAPVKKRCFPSDKDMKNTKCVACLSNNLWNGEGHSEPKELPGSEASFIAKVVDTID
ncbi:RNA-directed DNA polymerase, eukaryota [Tanacetum coccineum]